MVKTAGNRDSLFPTVTAPVLDSTYFDSSVFEPCAQRMPLGERIVDGSAQQTLGQMTMRAFEPDQGAADAFLDGAALPGADGGAQPGTRALFSQLPFDAVEVTDLAQQPRRRARGLIERLMELAPHVRPAARQDDLAFVPPDECSVRAVAIALDGAAKIRGDDLLQAGGGAAGLPIEEHVAAWRAIRPQISFARFAMPRLQIVDGSFVRLHVTSSQNARADRIIDRAQPIGGQAHPAGHRLAGQMHAMALPINLFLTVERRMIAIFGDEDLRQQPCGGQTALLQPWRQRRDDRSRVHIAPAHILAPDEPEPQKARRFIVELLADFLSDAAPRGGVCLDRLRVEHLLNEWQMIGPSGRAFVFSGSATGWRRLDRLRLTFGGFGRGILAAALQEQQQLSGIHLLALAAEEAADQRVDLLAQQRVLALQTLVLFAQLGFADGLAQGEADVSSTPNEGIELLARKVTPARTKGAALPLAGRCRR